MLEFSGQWPTILGGYAVKIAVAFLCGIVLGAERERKDKPAGLRTIVLITVGSTLYMIVSEVIPLIAEGPESIMRADPSRIAAQVVSGIGFLGAGTIIQARGSVHGLTTAAVIWVAAGIGLCIGVGLPVFAVGVTAMVLLALVVMDPIRHWLTIRGEKDQIELVVPNDSLALQRVLCTLREHEVDERDIHSERVQEDEVRVTLRYHKSGSAANRMLEALGQIEGVRGTRPYNKAS